MTKGYMWWTDDIGLSRIKQCWQCLDTRMPEERPNIKKTRSLDKPADRRKPIQRIRLLAQKENNLPVESNLSPEQIMDGASSTTALLNQILAQRAALHQLRDYGINE